MLNLRLKRFTRGVCLLLACTSAVAAAATAVAQQKSLSLQDAVLLALRYNPSIQNAHIDRVVDRFNLRVAKNEFELQYALSGYASYTENKVGQGYEQHYQSHEVTPEASIKSKIGTQLKASLRNTYDGKDYMPNLMLTVKQPLLRGFGKAVTEYQLNHAIMNEEINRLNLKKTIMNTVTTVINDYRALILSHNNVQIQGMSLKEAQRVYDVNQKRIKAGELEPAANIQQQLQIEQLKLSLIQAENQRDGARRQLLAIIGLPPESNINISTEVPIPKEKRPGLGKSIQQALKSNIDYQTMLMQQQQHQRDLVVAKDNQRWQLDFSANTSIGNTSRGNDLLNLNHFIRNSERTRSIRLDLTIPINDLTSKQKLVSAKAQLEKDDINFLSNTRKLKEMVANQVAEINNQLKQVRLSEQSLKLSKQVYTNEKKKQQAGLSSMLDVITNQNRLINTELQLIASKINYLNSIATLDNILGTTLDKWNIKVRS